MLKDLSIYDVEHLLMYEHVRTLIYQYVFRR
jgi:hypothetical protein